MAYRIETRADDGHVAVLADGSISAADIRHSLTEAFAAGLAADLPRVIVDMRKIDSLPPTSELYDVHLEMFLVHAGLETRSACALLVRADQQPEMAFYEDLARHRGIAYRLFADYPEALAWLRDEIG